MPEIKDNATYRLLKKTFSNDDEEDTQGEDGKISQEKNLSPEFKAYLDLQLKKQNITEEEYSSILAAESKSKEKEKKC